MTLPPLNTDDPVIKVFAGIILGMGLLGKVWPLIPAVKRRKQKRDTDEHIALKIIERDDSIKDLERRLGIRDDEVKKMQDELALLRPLRDEIEVVRNANAGLAAYNQQLTQEINDLRGRMDLS